VLFGLPGQRHHTGLGYGRDCADCATGFANRGNRHRVAGALRPSIGWGVLVCDASKYCERASAHGCLETVEIAALGIVDGAVTAVEVRSRRVRGCIYP
jgi:hypothetical protein